MFMFNASTELIINIRASSKRIGRVQKQFLILYLFIYLFFLCQDLAVRTNRRWLPGGLLVKYLMS